VIIAQKEHFENQFFEQNAIFMHIVGFSRVVKTKCLKMLETMSIPEKSIAHYRKYGNIAKG